MLPCYAFALLSPCVSWNYFSDEMPMKSFLSALFSQKGRRQKQLLPEDGCPSWDSHLLLLFNKSVAMATSRSPRKLGGCLHEPSVLLHGPPPRGFRPCIWLSHRQEYKPFLGPVSPQHGHSGSGTIVVAPDLSLTISFFFLIGFWLWLPLALYCFLNLH